LCPGICCDLAIPHFGCQRRESLQVVLPLLGRVAVLYLEVDSVDSIAVFLFARAYLCAFPFLCLLPCYDVCDILATPDYRAFVLIRSRVSLRVACRPRIVAFTPGFRLGAGRLLEDDAKVRVFTAVHLRPGRNRQAQSDCHKSV
jgi:hypothetical protein